MPVYEYKGQHYELSTTDPAEAKAKILSYLGQQTAPAVSTPTSAAQAVSTAPTEPPLSGMSGEFAGFADVFAPPQPKQESVLQGQPMPEPARAQDKLLAPGFVEAVKRNLDAMEPAQRQAALTQMARRPDVYGRAAKVLTEHYRQLESAEPTKAVKQVTDTRQEAIRQYLIEQGLDPEAATYEARKRALEGRVGRLQQIAPDVVGMEASRRAAETAEELRGAGFVERVGAEVASRVKQQGLGIGLIAADLFGGNKAKYLDALKVAGEVGAAIPKGDSILERSGQQAIASLTSQAPFIVLGALTNTALPVLAQAGLEVLGTEYGQGRRAGLSAQEAFARASLLSTSELVFERFGLTETFKAIRGAVNRIPTSELSGYLAKALAKEVPAEQLTQATNFVIDKMPEIGLNPNAGWKQFLEGQEEALRQTVLQSGALSGAVMGTAKGVQVASDLMRDREPGYQQDTSYEGLSEALARRAGFLQPTQAPTPAPEPVAATAPVEPAVERRGVAPTLKAEEREARTNAIAAAHMDVGVDPTDALAMARSQVEREYGKAAEAMPTSKAPENRLELLTQEFIAAGEDPTNARTLAERQVKEEDEADALAAETEKGAKDVTRPVQPADRVGAPVAGQPRVEPPAAGVRAPQPSGVVPTAQPSGVPAERKGAAPAAVTTPAPLGLRRANATEKRRDVADFAIDFGNGAKALIDESSGDIFINNKEDKQEGVVRFLDSRKGTIHQVSEFPDSVPQGLRQLLLDYHKTVLDDRSYKSPETDAARNAARKAISDWIAQQKTQAAAPTETPTTVAEDAEAEQAATQAVGEMATQMPEAKPKRGRKPVALSEEDKAKKAAALKEYKRKYAQGTRELDRVGSQLDLATAPFDETVFADEDALKAAQEERRSNFLQAVRSLLNVERNYRGTPLGDRAKALLADRAKIPQKDYDNIKRGFELTNPSKSLVSSRIKANPLIKGQMTAAQVLTAISKNGTPFERMMANRLRRFLVGVQVYVVEEGDPVPPRIQQAENAEAWDRARGVYLAADQTGPREVYLRGASFGYQNGTNNVTALHELLHAAINYRIGLGLVGGVRGKYDAPLVRFVEELSGLMIGAGDQYLRLKQIGLAPQRLQDLVEATAVEDPDTGAIEYEIFTLPQEFLAYGLTDPVFQQYLMAINGQRTDESAFSRFVRAVLELLGLAPKEFTALSDLINITDDIFGAQTAGLIMPASNGRAFMASKIKLTPEQIAAAKEQKKIDAAVAAANAKFDTSKLAEEYAQGVSAAQMVQNPAEVAPVLRGLWAGATEKTRKALVKLPTTEFIATWAGEDVPELKNTATLLQKMNGLMMQLLKSAGELTKEMERAYRKDPSLREKLDRITRVATLAEVDPSDPTATKRSADLDKQYEALGEDGQRLFKRIKNQYESISEYFTYLLNEQITRSGLSIAEQNNLLKKVRALYEAGSKITPYFPLVRRGDYWFSMGTGKNRVFMMFESLAERDRAIDGFLSERVKKKTGESDAAFAKRRQEVLDELLADETWGKGNDISALRQKTTQSSQLLTGMFAAIDASNLTDPNAKEQLKDDIYQLYLQTMPEQSFRRQFIHRKGLAGFRTDLLQDVADTMSKMAVQLSRIKYAPQLRNSLSQAQDYIKNTPEYEPFVAEMRTRVNEALNPGEEGVAAHVANALNQLAFVYYLGGASSALLQPLSLIQTGMPVLSRYGSINANREFLKAMSVWKTLGMYKTNRDGTSSWVAPSIEFAKGLNADERLAVREMLSRDVTTSTYANAVFDYKVTPSTQTSGPVTQFGKDTVNVLVLGGLMHSTERLTREMMYLMSYRLNRQAGKNHAEAVNQAVFDTNEALGNYGEYNRPTFMKGAAGKVVTQFMMYPVHVTLFLFRNFIEMIRPMDGRTRWEATQKFFGTLGATLVLGGAVALPMFSTVMGFIGAAWSALSGEDERPKEIRDMSFELWWRTKWLDEMLGEVQIGGKKLSDIVERGAVNAITGADISSRVSLNNLWFRETKEEKDIKSEAANLALSAAGPAVNAIVSVAEGFSAGMSGDYKKMVQKMAPAGFRNFASTYNLWQEGAKDNKGTQILSRDAFTTGELLFQAVGFRPDLLANTQYINFKVIGLEQKILRERSKLLEQLDRSYREGDGDAYAKYMRELTKFNTQYPTYKVSMAALQKSLMGKAERRGTSYRGIDLTEKNIPVFADVMRPSRLAAQEREAKAQK